MRLGVADLDREGPPSQHFVAFARSLEGDEKSEAQLFLDRFFRALGHGGVQEAGATRLAG